MATYYAWSKFISERNEAGQPTGHIMPGESVTKDKLGIESDEEWEYLISTGAVREDKYPEDLPDNVSPAEAARAEAAVSGDAEEIYLTQMPEAAEMAARQQAGESLSATTTKQAPEEAASSESSSKSTKSDK